MEIDTESYSLWKYSGTEPTQDEDPVTVILGEKNEPEFSLQAQFNFSSQESESEYLIDEVQTEYEQQRLDTGVPVIGDNTRLQEFDESGYRPASD